jgi:CheY-like chemotaxis protein
MDDDHGPPRKTGCGRCQEMCASCCAISTCSRLHGEACLQPPVARAAMIDSFVKIAGAIAPFMWPMVALMVLWRFTPVLRDFLANLSEGSVKAFGVEATAKRKATEEIAKANLKAEDPKASEVNFKPGVGKSWRLADLVTSIIPANFLEGRSALWVDDKPEGNLDEQQAFATFGLSILTATNTEQALRVLDNGTFDVIISDLKRGSDDTAGFAFLEELKTRKDATPVIFYTATFGPGLEKEAVSRGAYALTNQASDLLLILAEVIGPKRQRESSGFLHWLRQSRPRANRSRDLHQRELS